MMAAPGPFVPRSGRSEPLQASRCGKRFSRQRFCFHAGHTNRQVTRPCSSARARQRPTWPGCTASWCCSRAELGAVMACSVSTGRRHPEVRGARPP